MTGLLFCNDNSFGGMEDVQVRDIEIGQKVLVTF